jgi:hydrogenase maturation factor
LLLIVGQTCATCSDEARPARVLSVDEVAGLALVTIGDTDGEVDISLIDHVEPGAVVLIHGGVAIGKL